MNRLRRWLLRRRGHGRSKYMKGCRCLVCKQAQREYAADYYARNRDRINAARRTPEARAKQNAYMRDYRAWRRAAR